MLAVVVPTKANLTDSDVTLRPTPAVRRGGPDSVESQNDKLQTRNVLQVPETPNLLPNLSHPSAFLFILLRIKGRYETPHFLDAHTFKVLGPVAPI